MMMSMVYPSGVYDLRKGAKKDFERTPPTMSAPLVFTREENKSRTRTTELVKSTEATRASILFE